MNGLHKPLMYVTCVLLVLLSGCVSTEVGDATYQNKGILVNVNSTSPMPDAFMQVTVYVVKGLQQQESLYVTSAVNLTPGENAVFFPAPLQPGIYKLRIYLIHNGERKTAVIRDIVV